MASVRVHLRRRLHEFAIKVQLGESLGMRLRHHEFLFALTPCRIKDAHLAGPGCFILAPIELSGHMDLGIPHCA